MAKDTPPRRSPLFDSSADRAEFDRFTNRLIGLARNHLNARLQHKVDPEDVVQSAFKSFINRYGDQDVPAHHDVDGLWSLLTLITIRKCADRARYYGADRRDASREAIASPGAKTEPWREVAGREPTPEHATSLAEIVENILRELSPDERPVVELSLQGYTTREISERLGRAERSVRRLRERLRQRVERLQADAAEEV
jgi:RNA polymerase sigma-70 factor (ECF subfamily)